MSAKARYEYFRLLFELEEKRLGELAERAKFYLAVPTGILGALALKLEVAHAAASAWVWGPYAAGEA